MKSALNSKWGRLFRNWEHLIPDEKGYPDQGKPGVKLKRSGFGVFLKSFGILWKSIREAPEFQARQRHRKTRKSKQG